MTLPCLSLSLIHISVIFGIFSDSPERVRNQCQDSTLIDTVSVSYTHLDVYKRQGFEHPLKKHPCVNFMEVVAFYEHLYQFIGCLLYTSRCV